MAKKLPRRLVALSVSAVATVYFAGLLSTRAAANAIATDATTASSTAPTTTTATAPTSGQSVVVGATATSATTSTASSGYADGTYSGTGSSRFGNVTVSVTTSGGKVTNVQITRVTTSYPVSRIASLPAAVVQSQSASINSVTGATYSSQAFKQAIQAALSQALAAKSTAAAA